MNRPLSLVTVITGVLVFAVWELIDHLLLMEMSMLNHHIVSIAAETSLAFIAIYLVARSHEQARTERLRADEYAAVIAAIGQVTAGVAHEIRNPLSTIGGFARMIQRPGAEVEAVKRNAAIIVDEVGKLETILGDLLDLTKPSPPHFTESSIRAVLEASVQVVRPRAERRHAQLNVEIADDLPLVPMDRGQIQQVMTNLMLNALDAIPEGGTVTARAWREDNFVKLAVSDTGQGIPRSHLDQVFDTFFTTKPTGTGLGLALARKVIADHGATVQGDSQEGQGTTFTITFNLDQTVPPPPSGMARRKRPERGRLDGEANDTGN